MTSTPPANAQPKWMTITGWVLGILPCCLLLFSAWMKLSKSPQAVEGFSKYPGGEKTLMVIGALELACTVLYLVPRTSVLGAVLLTGYLGGAIHVHVQLGDGNWTTALVVSLGLWFGLFFRYPAVRGLLPLRRGA